MTEKEFKTILKEEVRKVIFEAARPMNIEDKNYLKISTLVQQANEACQKSCKVTESDMDNCLMDKEQMTYGLTGLIKLSKKGIILIPYKDRGYSYYPIKAKVFSVVNGKCVPYKDFMDDDWTSCIKELKCIIADAQRNINYYNNYDPAWDEEDFPNRKKTLKQFNKDNGFLANTNI